MADLQVDKSYQKVIEDLHKWHRKILLQLDDMYNNILLDMNTTLDDVRYFASFTNTLLIEHEKQLAKARTNQEIDIIQERINQILSEVQLLQSLSFHLNYNSAKLTGQLRINYNNNDIKSNCSLIESPPSFNNTPRTISDSSDLSTNNEQIVLANNKYRVLISRMDAIELKKNFLSVFHLTSYENEFIHECVLTFNVSDLDSFLDAFTSFWSIFPTKNEIRMLILQCDITFVMGKLGETSQQLTKRFQLNQIKVFPHTCPKSDERILLINGNKRDLIKDCIEEIYFNIEEKNKKEFLNQNMKLYNPEHLSTNTINKIILENVDYGGFIPDRSRLNPSRSHETEDDENTEEDEDLWDENDEWWNFRPIRDNNSEIIQREMIISSMHAGVVIGINATRIDRIKQKTGAYVYVNGETTDLKRTVFMKGTREQVDRAYACIENLIERYKNDKLPMKQRRSHGKRKGK